jgi:hypothetical protein
MAETETTPLLRSRVAALAAGAKQYMSGRPCPQGHVGLRQTANGSCFECNRIGAKVRYERGYRPPEAGRRAALQKWNVSNKGYIAKQKWAAKNEKNAWAVSVVSGAKRRSITRGLPCDIDKDYVASIAPDACPALGIELVYVRGAGPGVLQPDSPSLDRIVPERGYVRGNVVVISMRANIIKHNATAVEIRRVADWLETMETNR